MADELVITRIFDAPRERVWKAWTDPEEAKKWWGPKDFTAPHISIDFTVGGTYLFCMHGPAGSPFDKDFWSTGVYKEIIPLEKIVTTDSFADEKGNVVPSTYYGMSGFPLEMLVTVMFEDQNGKTKMTLRHSGIESISDTDRKNMEQGWGQSFDKLAESLK
jgi:uncharacterized protein YndB with AHSA1/START domain